MIAAQKRGASSPCGRISSSLSTSRMNWNLPRSLRNRIERITESTAPALNHMAFGCSGFSGTVLHRSTKQFPTLQTYGTDKKERAALGPAHVAHNSTTAQVASTASSEASVRSDSRSRRCTSYNSASGAPHQGPAPSLISRHASSDKSNYCILINCVPRELWGSRLNVNKRRNSR